MPRVLRFASAFAVVIVVAHPWTAEAQEAGPPDAGSIDAGSIGPTAAELDRLDPFVRDPADDELGRPTDDPADPMSVMDEADPLLHTTPPTEDELLEPTVRVVSGPVLTAIAGVRETEHHTAVRLAMGLVIVDETITLTSSARHRAEALVRIAVPGDAHLVSLEVCNDAGCRGGVPDGASAGEGAYDDALIGRNAAPSPLPVGHAAIERDRETGPQLVVRAAPITRDDTITIHARWVASTPVHGGAVRITLPALAADARAAPRLVTMSADDLVEPALDALPYERAVELRPGEPALLSALVPRTVGAERIEAWSVPCGASHCLRTRALAPRPAPRAQRLVVAIDASPSTSLGARGRIVDAVRVLLSILPAGSEVRLVAFAARVEAIGEGAPDAIDLDRVRAAIGQDLGSSTRYEALLGWLRGVEALARDSRVVVIGDGGITSSPGSFAAWADARDAHVVVSGVNVADRPSMLALRAALEESGGVALDVGPEAARASEGHGDDALAERLHAVLATHARPVHVVTSDGDRIVGLLRDGEDLVHEGMSARRGAISVGESTARAREPEGELREVLLAHLTARSRLVAVDPADVDDAAGTCTATGERRARRTSIASAVLPPGRARIALAHRRSCALPPAPEPARARSLPSRPLLAQLRRRVIPAARACFRDDRRGRADYSVRADIRVRLADRELVDTRVDGPITDELAACLASAFDHLDIPAFDGTIEVHWPLYTAAEPPPPTLELAPDVSRAVDRITR